MMWTDLAEADAGHRAAGFGQAAQRVPALAVEGVGAVVRRAVLLEEAAEGVKPVAERGDAHVVGPARQRRQLLPPVGARVVGVVVGAVDALLGVAADEMDAAAELRRPGHLRARDRERRQRPPGALVRGAGRRAVEDGLRAVQVRKVRAPGLAQALELPGMVRVGVALRESRAGGEGDAPGEQMATVQRHVHLPSDLLAAMRRRRITRRHRATNAQPAAALSSRGSRPPPKARAPGCRGRGTRPRPARQPGRSLPGRRGRPLRPRPRR